MIAINTCGFVDFNILVFLLDWLLHVQMDLKLLEQFHQADIQSCEESVLFLPWIS